jgi:hypothetical protein
MQSRPDPPGNNVDLYLFGPVRSHDSTKQRYFGQDEPALDRPLGSAFPHIKE